MSRYFSKFPLVDYNGTPAKNLLARVDFTDQTKKDIYSNFDYVLEEGRSRPDILSYDYYNSSQYDWLIYLSNNVIDPYHDYYKSQGDLVKHITAKYGTISSARRKILFYRNDWASDESLIPESVYNSIDNKIQKYWKPKLNNTNQVLGYERVKEDWIVSTNKIIRIVISEDVTNFSEGDIIKQGNAEGTVVSINIDDSSIILQHITGTFTATDGITSITLLKQNIDEIEEAFWAPVDAYSYEEEQNELKKYINVIKASYLPDIEKLVTELLRQ